MGLDEYEKAVHLMNDHPELQGFVGERSETLVQAAEKTLGLKFPPSYRRFVLEFGAGNFGAFEVYGVIHSNFESSSVPDAVWCTLDERKSGDLPPDLVVIHHDGFGGYHCIDCKKSPEEGPIVTYYPGYQRSRQSREIIANDFGAFFLEFVGQQLELGD
jgi:hypothetical protein